MCTVTQVKKIVERGAVTVGGAVESMIKTGKLASSSGLDLPQVLYLQFNNPIFLFFFEIIFCGKIYV